MKINVVLDSGMQMNLEAAQGESAEAAGFIVEMIRQSAPGNGHDEKRSAQTALVSLTTKQRAVYDAMLAFDQPTGVTVAGLATLLDYTANSVAYQVARLVDRGLAQAVSRGHYRAIPGD
jgi:hypothetical protein